MAKLFKKTVKEDINKSGGLVTRPASPQSAASIEFLSWDGYMRRGQFWKAYFALMIPGYVSYTIAPIISPYYYSWLLYSIWVFTGILSIFQVIKRLRDVNRSPWISLLLFLPVVNLYVMYLLFIKKSVYSAARNNSSRNKI